jgi:hypothetical protein
MNSEKELELINNYTRKPLKAEDVYTFTVTLCDNEIDRDFECFSKQSIETLKNLFVGKTGISDHSMRSKDQAARIYHCYIESDPTKKTSKGEIYTALKAKAYTVITDSTKTLIDEIDGGIKKEVSIGCAVSKITCSICGKDMKAHECSHIKGRRYKGVLCHGILEEPTDAYEWSFVAVPAQRNAGVTKSFRKKEEKQMNTNDIIKSMTEGTVLSDEDANALKSYIASLEAKAQQAEAYKSHLTEDIARFAGIIMPSVNIKHFTKGCEDMDIDTLKQLRDGMKKQAGEIFPVTSQIKPVQSNNTKNNNDFII